MSAQENIVFWVHKNFAMPMRSMRGRVQGEKKMRSLVLLKAGDEVVVESYFNFGLEK